MNKGMQFQFHNGSIKRQRRHDVEFEEEMFQFHNGSIKRGFNDV